MSEIDIHTEAEELREQLPAAVTLSVAEIEDKLETFVTEYKVPLEEARRSIISSARDEADVEQEDFTQENPTVELSDIDAPDEWVDVTAKVVDLWEPRSDAIAQVGLLGDETGTLKFTKWAKSDLPELTEGQVYRLENVVTDEYQGQYSVKLNRTTTIEEVDREIEVGDNTTTLEGALVDIQSGSGLIKRCPEEDCTRVLQNGRCSEHGEVEGEFDLRIKGVIDDGATVQEVIFDRESTEAAAGMTLQEAQDRAMDALDTSVVGDEIRDRLLGQYYRVEGPVMGRYLLVDSFEQLDDVPDAEQVLIRARSI